jgi:hypothetical protein
MTSGEFDGILILLGGFLGVAALCALVLAPLLYKTRVSVNLSVVDLEGRALGELAILGAYNRAGPAFQSTAEGFLGDRQLHGVRASLGKTDADGRFRKNYYFRNIHTVFVGAEEVFLTDALRSKMRLAPHIVRVGPTGTPTPAADWTDAFAGKSR